MGTTLYNRIQLGRGPLASRRNQALFASSLCGAALLAWLLLRGR